MRIVHLIVLVALFLFSCDGREVEVASFKDFSKADREQLGELIKTAILEDSEHFEILPNEFPTDSTYWFISTLYRQATLTMHLDRSSYKEDRWTSSNEWEVIIIENDDCFAFCVPGGDFFISTGFLRELENEYELYYVLTFEAKMMNDKLLLMRLIEQYNGMTLHKLLDGEFDRLQGVSIESIAYELLTLSYQEEIISENDKNTASEICSTSIFSRYGIISILETVPAVCAWLTTRPSYPERLTKIKDDNYIGSDCGAFTTNGNYAKYVLSRIQ